MADMKIPPGAGSLTVTRPPNGARAEALRAAQKAFFEAALGGTSVPAPQPKTAPSAQAAVQPSGPSAADQPQRYLRPGSRLDIKV